MALDDGRSSLGQTAKGLAARECGSREFNFSAADFERVRKLIYAHAGISLSPIKQDMVYSRLARRLRATGKSSFAAYLDALERDGGEEWERFVNSLTTNLTSFFREPHHFPIFADHLKQLGTRRPIRVWCSAASTGEEPYSIALTVLDMLPEAARLDVKILATDIDPVVVATARAGVYRADVQSVVPQPLRDKWLARDRESGAWKVKDEVKALVTFNQLNLIGAWPIKGPFDVIFCRNVVIYFEDETQAHVWGRFHKMLAPEGRLYVGHSERVDVPGYVSDGLTVYRKTGGRA